MVKIRGSRRLPASEIDITLSTCFKVALDLHLCIKVISSRVLEVCQTIGINLRYRNASQAAC